MAAALLAALGGCGAKRIASLPGVTGLHVEGSALIVDITVPEPSTALDAPVAIGQAVADVGARIRAGAPDLPGGTRDVVMRISLLGIDGGGHRSAVPWMSARLSVSSARQADWKAMIWQQALDRAVVIRFATPDAAAIDAAYCADPAHTALSPVYCRHASAPATA